MGFGEFGKGGELVFGFGGGSGLFGEFGNSIMPVFGEAFGVFGLEFQQGFVAAFAGGEECYMHNIKITGYEVLGYEES